MKACRIGGAYEAARIIVNYEGPASGSGGGLGGRARAGSGGEEEDNRGLTALRHPSFITCRSVRCPASYYKEIEESLALLRPDGSFAVVEPRAFFYLLRSWLGGKNECRAAWLFDTLPFPIIQGREIKFSLGVRNDGWDAWAAEGPDAVVVAAEFSPGGERRNPRSLHASRRCSARRLGADSAGGHGPDAERSGISARGIAKGRRSMV